MLNALRHWLARPQGPSVPQLLQRWAHARGLAYRRVRRGPGCVVEGPDGDWRIEWGPAQRQYIAVPELRLIAEVFLPPDLVVLVLNRHLADAMEKLVYEQYVDNVQTRSDAHTPAEMRWLVMHPRLAPQDLGVLQERYAAVASSRPWTQQWLKPPLLAAWHAMSSQVAPEVPVTLAIGRGRLVLRTALTEPDDSLLQGWFAVFEQALAQLRRLPV